MQQLLQVMRRAASMDVGRASAQKGSRAAGVRGRICSGGINCAVSAQGGARDRPYKGMELLRKPVRAGLATEWPTGWPAARPAWPPKGPAPSHVPGPPPRPMRQRKGPHILLVGRALPHFPARTRARCSALALRCCVLRQHMSEAMELLARGIKTMAYPTDGALTGRCVSALLAHVLCAKLAQ